MLKIIKKTGRIFLYFLLTLIVLGVTSYFILRTSKAQTFLTQKIASHYSELLGTRVEVGGVDIAFFNSVLLENVYVGDLHKDTLLDAERLRVDIRDLDFRKQKIYVSDVNLINTKIKIIKYPNERGLNYKFLLDAFSSSDTVKTDSAAWNFGLGGITLTNLDIAYRDKRFDDPSRGMDFEDIRVKSVNAQLNNFRFFDDSLQLRIKYLSATEKSGFILNHLSSNVTVREKSISMDNLKIRTPVSDIDSDGMFSFSSIDDMEDFVEKVKMDFSFRKSVVSMADIAFFAPELKGMKDTVRLKGRVSGKVGSLKMRDIELGLAKKTVLKGDVDMTGLPDIDNTFIVFNAKELITDYQDLRTIPVPPFDNGEKLEVPSNVALLGDIRFRGTFSGLISNFVAYGNFKTAMGEINSDVSLEESEDGKVSYSGKVQTGQFNIGRFMEIKDIGNVSLDIEVAGSGLTKENVNASLKKGMINFLEVNGYKYQNIEVRGDLARRIFKGELLVEDDNLGLVFSGDVDFNKKIPALDFTAHIDKADLAKLNLIKSEKSTDLTGSVVMKLNGDNIDNLYGTISIENTKFRMDTARYSMKSFVLHADAPADGRKFSLESDFADGNIHGKFKIEDLAPAFRQVLALYVPAIFEDRKTRKQRSFNDYLEYQITVKDADDFTRLFVPELQIARGTVLKGKLNSGKKEISTDLISPEIVYSGISFRDLSLKASPSNSGSFSLEANSSKIKMDDSVWVDNFVFSSRVENDSAAFSIDWKNNTKRIYKGDIDGVTTFIHPQLIRTRIAPSSVYLQDSLWNIRGTNEITFDSGRVHINDFAFVNNSQQIGVTGTISRKVTDALFVTLNNFNLINLDKYLEKDEVKLRGIVNGKTTISDVFGNIVFTSNSNFSGLFVNREKLGDGSVEALYDRKKEAVYLQGNFSKGIPDPETGQPIKNIVFSGFYYPNRTEENLDIETRIYAMQLSLVQPYVKDYCTVRGGQFGGTLAVKGSLKRPKITGSVDLTAKALTVNYLNTTYWVSNQNIKIEENAFVLENFKITDQYNDTLTINNGHVFHDNFKNFQLDFDMAASRFMVLNTTEADNSLYFGSTFVTGIISVFGFIDQAITIDANVKTDKTIDRSKNRVIHSSFHIPLESIQEVGENEFITFVVKDSTQKKKEDYKVKLDGIKLNFDVEVTPDAELQLVFDSKVGDVIRARGNGDLKMKINTLGAFNMYGDFTVESGDYLFTLGNVINKRFRLEKGGNLKWDGDPYQAVMDMSAVYQVRTSLKPFFPSDSSGIYKKRYPVDCVLNLDGPLMNPAIAFNIDLPTVDESTRQQVKDMINTEQETNKQVFSLLVLNSFVTPPVYRDLASESQGPNAGAATGSELLSNQLSNWLSQISNDFDIGVKYRPGDKVSSDEVELALSTQLFNDKVTIDANVGMGTGANSNQNANNIVGDMNVEYKLTDNGKVRVKAFNKSNDNTINNIDAPYTQGVGFLYREEFNTLNELYDRYKKKLDGVFTRRKVE